MKHLHIVNTDKFIEPFIRFINANFDIHEHQFLSITSAAKKNYIKECYKNVSMYNKVYRNWNILRDMYDFEHIYIHSLFDMRVVVILFFQPWLLKKCYWIVWGGDLYAYREPKKTFKSKVKEFIKSKVIKNVGHVCTLVKSDYDLAKKIYNVKGKYLPAIYISEEKNNAVLRVLETTTVKNSNTIKIIVGNSATKSNYHIEVFKLLEKFSTQNIEIYCPLSYGDASYAEEVITYGTTIFNEKFKPIVEFMNIDEYIEFLGTMDIGIFNNDRQQGLGNIYSLLHLGKKVYLREGTTMWNEIHNEKSLVVHTLDSINLIDFEEFQEFSNEYRLKNKIIMDERYDSKTTVQIWRNIFEAI
ncbi:TDP-N-acetylfucosamine:lipid II N-acetylfucosaminyltransferase [Bacillus sp. 37MA]|uniref:TDP-N-acetylfucosamine:lipid II N-acetylfucosaminyltransferase n=1 Tax=Bacillus sp. 37MA TaxID=1132442 RepID=UPI00036474C9|nr:TDP-N-acetylfucosamine:lipid II N-acetylfucosaminyltransferase [Bacillus sp. 37MA]